MNARGFAVILFALLGGGSAFAASGDQITALNPMTDEQFQALVKPAMEMFSACHYLDQIDFDIFQEEEFYIDGANVKHSEWSKDDAARFANSFRTIVSGEKHKYVDRQALEYARVFSEEELNAMSSFCRTPIGSSYAQKRAKLDARFSYLDSRYLEDLLARSGIRAFDEAFPKDKK